MKTKHIILIIVCIALQACTNSSEDSKGKSSRFQQEATVTQVQTMKLSPSEFKKELISNGKLVAIRKCALQFEQGEVIQSLPIYNGKKVRKGDLLAAQNNFRLSNALDQAKQNRAKARLAFEDLLIGQGYEMKDSLAIPANIWRIAEVKSGWGAAKTTYQKALHDYQASKLYAPFDGIIANLNTQEYEKSNANEAICTLIDPSCFRANFSIMESEFGDLQNGDEVIIQPYSSSVDYKGKLTQINPQVDENGLIQLSAEVNNPDGKLMEGMNIKVIIQKAVPEQMIVPKSAVLLRQNQEVVFTHNNGEALWHYVKTDLENSHSFTIKEGLQFGDEIIVGGNLNLSHEAQVKANN